MSTYYSPTGNPEVWEEKPDGYFTVAEWQEMHPVPAPAPPTEAQLSEMLRISTEYRLAATDKYATVDFPDNDLREKMLAYRAALRALNHQPGAPWDGGGDETPWPTIPQL